MKMLPVLGAAFRWRERPVGTGWRMDETYFIVAGQRKHLTARSTATATTSTSCCALSEITPRPAHSSNVPSTCTACPRITIDGRGSNTAAIASIQADSGLPVEMRQSKRAIATASLFGARA